MIRPFTVILASLIASATILGQDVSQKMTQLEQDVTAGLVKAEQQFAEITRSIAENINEITTKTEAAASQALKARPDNSRLVARLSIMLEGLMRDAEEVIESTEARAAGVTAHISRILEKAMGSQGELQTLLKEARTLKGDIAAAERNARNTLNRLRTQAQDTLKKIKTIAHSNIAQANTLLTQQVLPTLQERLISSDSPLSAIDPDTLQKSLNDWRNKGEKRIQQRLTVMEKKMEVQTDQQEKTVHLIAENAIAAIETPALPDIPTALPKPKPTPTPAPLPKAPPTPTQISAPTPLVNLLGEEVPYSHLDQYLRPLPYDYLQVIEDRGLYIRVLPAAGRNITVLLRYPSDSDSAPEYRFFPALYTPLQRLTYHPQTHSLTVSPSETDKKAPPAPKKSPDAIGIFGITTDQLGRPALGGIHPDEYQFFLDSAPPEA